MSNQYLSQGSGSSVIYFPIPLKLKLSQNCSSHRRSKSGDHVRNHFSPPHTPTPRQIQMRRFESETQERPSNAQSQDDKFQELIRQLTPFDNESLLQEIELIE